MLIFIKFPYKVTWGIEVVIILYMLIEFKELLELYDKKMTDF